MKKITPGLNKYQRFFCAVKKLLRRKKNWTKGANARNYHGVDVYFHDQAAVKFCLLGAVWRASKGNKFEKNIYDVFQQALPLAYKKTPSCLSMESAILKFNDAPATRYEDIQQFLDNCIRLVEKKFQKQQGRKT